MTSFETIGRADTWSCLIRNGAIALAIAGRLVAQRQDGARLLLQLDDVRTRIFACIELAKCGRSVIPELTARARDATPSVRKWVLWTLGEIGDGTDDVIRILIDSLADPDCGRQAMVALQKIGSRAVPRLTGELAGTQPCAIVAAFTLLEIGTDDAVGAATLFLASKLDSELGSGCCDDVVAGLARAGERAIPALRQALQQSPAAARNVVRVVSRMGASAQALRDDLLMGCLVPSWSTPEARAAVERLDRDLEVHESWPTRHLASDLCSMFSVAPRCEATTQDASLGELVEGLMENEDPSSCLRALKQRVLLDGGCETALAVPALVDVLETGLVDRASLVLEVLQHIGPDAAAAFEAVRAKLAHPTQCVRLQAIKTLASIAPAAPMTAAAIRSSLRADDLQLRLATIAALEGLGAGAASFVGDLMAALELEAAEGRARCAACDALARIGLPAVPALVAALRSPRPDVRARAARVLGRMGPLSARALPDLVRAWAREESSANLRPRLLPDDVEWMEQAQPVTWAILQFGPVAVRYLTMVVIPREGPELRRRALWLIGALGPLAREAGADVATAMCDADESVSSFAFWAAGRVGTPVETLAPRIKAGLADPVRRGAMLLGLEYLLQEDAAAISLVVDALRYEPCDPPLPTIAVCGVGLPSQPPRAAQILRGVGAHARPALRAAASSENESIQRWAAWLLQQVPEGGR